MPSFRVGNILDSGGPDFGKERERRALAAPFRPVGSTKNNTGQAAPSLSAIDDARMRLATVCQRMNSESANHLDHCCPLLGPEDRISTGIRRLTGPQSPDSPA